jgi:hypothetical protein
VRDRLRNGNVKMDEGQGAAWDWDRHLRMYDEEDRTAGPNHGKRKADLSLAFILLC